MDNTGTQAGTRSCRSALWLRHDPFIGLSRSLHKQTAIRTRLDPPGLRSRDQTRIGDLQRTISASTYVRLKGPGRESTSLYNLLQLFRESGSIDPRDKVYALLSLAIPQNNGVTLTTDYTKDAHDLFWDVIAFCMPNASAAFVDFCRILRGNLRLTNKSLRAHHIQHAGPGLQPLGKRMHQQWSLELRLRFEGGIRRIIPFENIPKATRKCKDGCRVVFLVEKRIFVLQKIYGWALGVCCAAVRRSDEVYTVDDTGCTLVIRRQDDQCSIIGRAFGGDNVPLGDYESFLPDVPASRASAFPGLDLLELPGDAPGLLYMCVR